jgi:hypothetical protein
LDTVGAEHVDVGLRADYRRSGLLGDVRHVGDVIEVAVADQDMVGARDVLVDHGGLERQPGVRVRLAAEETGVGAAEPGVEEDRAVLEADLPGVRPHPSEVHAGRARASAPRRRLGALGQPGQHEGPSPVERDRRQAADDACAEELTAREPRFHEISHAHDPLRVMLDRGALKVGFGTVANVRFGPDVVKAPRRQSEFPEPTAAAMMARNEIAAPTG